MGDTRKKRKKPKLGSSADFLTRSAASLELLESLGLREMSTRESALFRLARGRSPAPREPRSPSPPPSPPRAARREPPEAVVLRPPQVASKPKPKVVSSPPDAATPLRVASWDQDTQCVFVRVAIPRGTPASRVRVQSETRSLHVRVVPEKTKAKWYGVSDDGKSLRVTDTDATLHGAPRFAEKNAPPTSDDARRVGGALSLPCVAGDTVWTIDRWSPNDDEHDDEHDIVSVVLTKASRYLSSPAWSKLFADDAEEKSLTQLARELAEADEPSPRHCDLPEAAQIALEDTRERRLMMGAGRWTPDDPAFDDFRVVLSNEGEEK